jgi:hypothetical protein
MLTATDTQPGTTETAKNMREVQNDFQIRQKDVDDFTEEEKNSLKMHLLEKTYPKLYEHSTTPLF